MLCACGRCHVLISGTGVPSEKQCEEDRERTINEESTTTGTQQYSCIGTSYNTLKAECTVLCNSVLVIHARRQHATTAVAPIAAGGCVVIEQKKQVQNKHVFIVLRATYHMIQYVRNKCARTYIRISFWYMTLFVCTFYVEASVGTAMLLIFDFFSILARVLKIRFFLYVRLKKKVLFGRS